jgi:hypothetical protein
MFAADTASKDTMGMELLSAASPAAPSCAWTVRRCT